MRDHWSEFEKRDTTALVISFAEPDALKDYEQRMRLPYPVAADPLREAYAAYGLRRGPTWRIWSPRVLWQYTKLLTKGRKLQRPRKNEDLSQLGGNFIIDSHSRLLYAHLSKSPADRPTVNTLLKELGP